MVPQCVDFGFRFSMQLPVCFFFCGVNYVAYNQLDVDRRAVSTCTYVHQHASGFREALF